MRLRQVLTNLLTNAAKFTDSGHVVASVELVELAPADDFASPSGETVPHLLFKVRDTGAGMREETQASLFQRFFQGQTGTTRVVSER